MKTEKEEEEEDLEDGFGVGVPYEKVGLNRTKSYLNFLFSIFFQIGFQLTL